MGVATAALGRDHVWMIAVGAAGPLLTALYFLQPAWRMRVTVDAETFEISRGDNIRVRLAWGDVKRLLVVPRWKVAFLDGGEPEKSFLLTGPGAPGPYRIDRRETLYDFLVAHVPKDKIEERETLEGG